MYWVNLGFLYIILYLKEIVFFGEKGDFRVGVGKM